MSTATDNPAHVGRHKFELAGLGKAPFRFVGLSVNVIRYPDGSSQAGGSCDYCGTGIANECLVESADGKRFKVGCDCIRKVDDSGLLRAYKSAPEVRAKQREAAKRADVKVSAELVKLIADNSATLQAAPHPAGVFVDRQTGRPLSRLDWAQWHLNHCGARGRASLLRGLKRFLSGSVPAGV